MITIILADMLLNYAFRNEEASVYAGLIDEEDVEITGYDGDRKPITLLKRLWPRPRPKG